MEFRVLPFPGGMESTPNVTLLLALAAAVLYGLILNTRPTWLRTGVKTVPAALLAVLTVLEGGPLLLFVALAFSALGDAFLSRDGDTAFLGGLGAFLAAHVAYVALFWMTGAGYGVVLAEIWRAALAGLLILFTLIMLVQLLRHIPPNLRGPVFLYVLAILSMGLMSLTTSGPLIIGGALLFIASDALLATEKFLASAISPHRDWMRFAVWGLYVAAQLAITLGFVG